jgi:hypothetical protein
MKNKLFLFFWLMSFSAFGQTVLLNVDKGKETFNLENGPNLKKFSHMYLRMAFLVSADKPGAKIIYGSSVNLALGVRNKYKISSVYSIGFEADIQYTDYKMKQTEYKILPDTIINNISQRLDYSSIALGYFNRINFDPQRGNFIGTYLDVGIVGEFHYSIKSISKNEMPDGTERKVVNSKLKYTNNTNVKAIARLGYSHFNLYGSYRLTDLFKSDSGFPDLPRVVFGIELSFF